MHLMNKMKRLVWMVSIWAGLVAVLISALAAAQSPWQAPQEAETYKNPISRNSKSIAAGKKVFMQYCILCHGEKGDGKGPTARSLEVPPANFGDKKRMNQSDGSLAWKILTGRGLMPSWAPVLSEEDIWNLINYIRGFAK